jgi:hypothetical protein
MKTIKFLFGVAAVLTFTACGNSTENTTTTTEPPAEAPATPKPHTNTTPKEDPDHTEVIVDENGVKYSKKSGKNETDVKVKADSNSVRIRRSK